MSFWYCPECREEISSANVTYQELHDSCGYPVKWIETEGTITFGEALEAAKRGSKITRDGWNGKGMFVYYQEGSNIPRDAARNPVLAAWPEESIAIRPHLDMKTAQGDIQIGWLASQSDMLAEDWRVIK